MPCDYSRYPTNWKEIRARVLERDGHKCKFCGVPNHVIVERDRSGNWTILDGMQLEVAFLDGVKTTRIVLTIAHLDGDKGDNEDRMAALCQRCHLLHDIKHHVSNAAMGRRLKKEAAGQVSLLEDEA